ncbi:MAG: hypothetical protein IJL85_00900, partial [Erysipelotrichaceae bacterium]|nr:hypothetical protein [Erysipelotrichaceae bacterium]
MNRISDEFYPMIFKRKSFHAFKDPATRKAYRDEYGIFEDELKEIQKSYDSLVPLYPGIRTAMRIAENEETSCERGQEKVLL